MASLTDGERKKIHYGLDLLVSQERVSKKFVKFVKDDIYELRSEYEGNIYRIFFIFDKGMIVVLFNGFQKKTQKTPESEIRKAIEIKNMYYANKK
jgi:phage-related protein